MMTLALIEQLKKIVKQRYTNTGQRGTEDTVIVGVEDGIFTRVDDPCQPYVIFARHEKFGCIRVAIPKPFQNVQFYPGEMIDIKWDAPTMEGVTAYFVRKIPYVIAP